MNLHPRWACVALVLLAIPDMALAGMGMGNSAPTVTSLTVSPSPLPANATATITCSAADTDGSVTALSVTVAGGLLPGGGTTEAIPVTAAGSVSGSISWTTPGAGNWTVTCTATDSGGMFSGAATGSQTITVAVQAGPTGSAPVLDQLTAGAAQVVPGSTVQLAAAAHDPDGAPLQWSWSASGGALTSAADAATWTAPATPGTYTITIQVSDGSGFVTSGSLQIRVSADVFTTAVAAPIAMPRRIAVLPNGDLVVTDAAAPVLSFLTPHGTLKGSVALPEAPAAVAACAGRVVVATHSGRALLFDFQARPLGTWTLSQGPLVRPSGMSCDAVRGLLYIAERDAGRVRAVWPDGTTAYQHLEAGGLPLTGVADVAVDPVNRRLLVLLDTNQLGDRSQLLAFSLDGVFQSGLVPFGSGTGKVTRGSGVAVGPSGRFYVADAFQGQVQSFAADGSPQGELGVFGAAPGQLQQPSGLAVTARGDLFVANTGAGRLEVFGTGLPLPACAFDTDCDGMSDAWELAHGLNPTDARDAFADADGDGLTNGQEFAWNTDPRRADTDGDGWTDGEEVALGFNPILSTDHRPIAMVADVVSNPGLVQLEASISGRGTCGVTWGQAAGAPVTLRNPGSLTPSFVGRAAGTYVFTATPRCNGVDGAAASVSATVTDLAPVAQAGLRQVVAVGESFLLDGSQGWDPNGGALVSTWDQVVGPPLLAFTPGSSTSVRAWRPGLSIFSVTSTDPAGKASAAEVPVLVVDPAKVALTVVVDSPVTGRVGQAVALDATASLVPHGAGPVFSWQQLEGTPVALTAADTAQASFIPTDAGRYRFQVSLRQGTVTTLPEIVEVFVAQAQSGLPVASAPTRVSARVGEPLRLDGSRSTPATAGNGLSWTWRLVSGAAVGLTQADQAQALVVPFVAGSSFLELTVREGDAVSLPVLVRVDADKTGVVRPTAQISAPAVETVDVEVALDGRASQTGAAALTWRWTQVSGPWVGLMDARSSVATFTPRAPGLYVFQLEVGEGSTWSAPTTVGVLVFPATTNGGRQP